MTVNADFLISPAYFVPTMMISIRFRWSEDRRAGAGSLGGRVGLEARHVDDREVGLERGQRLARRDPEQVAREHAGPGGLGVDAKAPSMGLVGADVQVLRVERAVLHVRHQARAEAVVVRLADLVVDLAPPDLVLAPRLADDELVPRRAARVLPGADDERALGGDRAFFGRERVLVQLGDGEVGEDGAGHVRCATWARGQGHDRYLGLRRGRRGARHPSRPAARGGRVPGSRLPQSRLRFGSQHPTRLRNLGGIAQVGETGLRDCAVRQGRTCRATPRRAPGPGPR